MTRTTSRLSASTSAGCGPSSVIICFINLNEEMDDDTDHPHCQLVGSKFYILQSIFQIILLYNMMIDM